MAKRRRKSGSNVVVNCQLCGKEVTRAGLIGHMEWKHGKDYKAPMLNKGISKADERLKAALYDSVIQNLKNAFRGVPLFSNDRTRVIGRFEVLDNEVFMVDFKGKVTGILQWPPYPTASTEVEGEKPGNSSTNQNVELSGRRQRQP